MIIQFDQGDHIRLVQIGAGQIADKNTENYLKVRPYGGNEEALGFKASWAGNQSDRWFQEDEVLKFAAALIVMVEQARDRRTL